MKHRCPICRKAITTSLDNKEQRSSFLPFCSSRCKLIDLGAWLDGKYNITSGFESEQSGELSGTSSKNSTEGR